MVARSDENWDGMSPFKLDAQKLSGVRRHAVMLEQIAAAADDVDALVNGKLDAASQRIAQSLAAPSRYLGFRPRKGRIQVHV
jgi:hypothetical protein